MEYQALLPNKLTERVKALELNLKGKVVLTEAATGAYMVTPVLAALAGARVYAYTRNSSYGTVQEAISRTRSLVSNFAKEKLDITFIEELTPGIIAQADIITNSGHLRPLDREKLQYAKDTLVISLMYEAWEWRKADMDIEYIRERGFKIGATNERHPDIDVFNYLGDMAIKFIFDSGLCCYQNKFVLICNNDFGPYIAKGISKICGGLGVIDKEENRNKYNLENTQWLGDFPYINIPEEFKNAEAILFAAYPFDITWIGKNCPISVNDIKKQFTYPYILRFEGDIDTKSLDEAGVNYYPEQVKSGHMGIVPSAIGYDPIIRLQSGGLKVAEALITANYSFNGVRLLDLM